MKTYKLFQALLSVFMMLWGNQACMKLDPEVYDKVSMFWQTDDQIAAGVAPAYSGLRDYVSNSTYNLNECSTDEVIVPIRGADWADNGIWEKMWKHSWQSDHPFMAETWQFINTNIARVNLILETVNNLNPQPPDLHSIQAELKTVRAYNNYIALDLYGNVPIVNDNNATGCSQLGNKSRAEVFTYVEKEIKDNLTGLSTEVNPKTYGRVTQWFAQALLAKLYLNAQVYTGKSRWNDCIAACDAILISNKYTLEENFFANFLIANEKSRENIFVIPFDFDAGLNYFYIQGETLHNSSYATFGLESGGWNGFCSTAEYLSIFDIKDIRRKMFLVGQQYINQIIDSAHIQYDTDVNLPLIFDPVITKFSNPGPESRMLGARCAKWEFNKSSGGSMSNDFAIYRLADIILMKAEAQFRNGDIPGALITINQKINNVSIRSRAGLPDFGTSEMTADGLLAERARELSWEGHRRNDMIRLGHFTDARIPEKAVSENFRTLYPIPKAELDKNPCLVQNPGY